MNTRQLLTATLLVISTAGVLAVDQCEPNCSGHAAGDYVEDPMNCTQFYVCLPNGSPSDHPVPCETGHFDPSTSACVAGDDCEATCKPVPCHLSCSAPYDLVSDKNNCSIYYVCDASLTPAMELDCFSDNPYFNGNTCTNDKDQCCTVQCNPYCNPGDVQIPDPYDCKKYYICLEEGPVNPTYHFECESDENFNIGSGMCKKGATCETLCSNKTTTDNDTIATTTSPTTTSPTTTSPTTTSPTTTSPTTTSPTTTSPTTTSPTTTSPTTTSPSGCLLSFTCPASGSYPQCPTCQRGYFKCSAAGEPGVLANCSQGFVFNTDPNYAHCIPASECPYSPLS